MSAPLSFHCLEVLRGLMVGLELRKIGGGWRFVGHWQDPAASSVLPETMHPLLDAGYVLEHEGRGTITDAGKTALALAERAIWVHCSKGKTR